MFCVRNLHFFLNQHMNMEKIAHGRIPLENKIRLFLYVTSGASVRLILRINPPKIVDILWNAKCKEQYRAYAIATLSSAIFRWKLLGLENAKHRNPQLPCSCKESISTQTVGKAYVDACTQCELPVDIEYLTQSCQTDIDNTTCDDNWAERLRIRMYRREKALLQWKVWSESVKFRVTCEKNAKLSILIQHNLKEKRFMRSRNIARVAEVFYLKLKMRIYKSQIKSKLQRWYDEIETLKCDALPPDPMFLKDQPRSLSNGLRERMLHVMTENEALKAENSKLKRINSHILSALNVSIEDSLYYV